MELKNNLEVILPTYNRKKCLEQTFKQIFAHNSPIRGLDITVLDNASSDSTDDLIKHWKSDFKNLKYIRNNRNIGGNANIARCFELAAKKYLWVLCDDDFFDFSHFDEVEKAIEDSYDLIIVNMEPAQLSKLRGHKTAKILRCLTFLPSGIIRTSNIKSFTMINAYGNISNWFPHLAVTAPIVADRGRIKIVSKNIVLYGGHINDNLKYQKAIPVIKELCPKTRNCFFYAAYLSTLEIIENKKIRREAVEYFSLKRSFFHSIMEEFKGNRIFLNNYCRNLFDPWPSLCFSQKLRYLTALFCLDIFYFLKYPKYYLRKKRKVAEWQKIKEDSLKRVSSN